MGLVKLRNSLGVRRIFTTVIFEEVTFGANGHKVPDHHGRLASNTWSRIHASFNSFMGLVRSGLCKALIRGSQVRIVCKALIRRSQVRTVCDSRGWQWLKVRPGDVGVR